MVAQIIVINQNGVDQARTGKGLNNWYIHDIEKEADIKTVIQATIADMVKNKTRGHLLVKWHDKLFVCEPKGVTYSRVQVEYHPLADKFSL